MIHTNHQTSGGFYTVKLRALGGRSHTVGIAGITVTAESGEGLRGAFRLPGFDWDFVNLCGEDEIVLA